MILRRFIKHITDQNWFAVGLDVLVVITGIFLGMQVTEWNEDRQEHMLEESYYEQLIIDLKEDITIGERAIMFAKDNDNYANLLFKAIDDPEFTPEDPTYFMLSTARAGYAYIPTTNQQTYTELTSTGNLRLLRDVTLKRKIVGYYRERHIGRQWDSLIRTMQVDYRRITSGLLSREHMRQGRYGDELESTPDEVITTLKKARERDGLKEILSRMAGIQERLRQDGIRMKKDAEELIARLQAHLRLTQ